MATPTLRYVAPTGNEPTHLEPEPVIIHDLPAGGDTSALEAQIAALTTRVEALEQA